MKRERAKETSRDNPLPRSKTLVLLPANNNKRVVNNNKQSPNRQVTRRDPARRRTRRERIRTKTRTRLTERKRG